MSFVGVTDIGANADRFMSDIVQALFDQQRCQSIGKEDELVHAGVFAAQYCVYALNEISDSPARCGHLLTLSCGVSSITMTPEVGLVEEKAG